MNHRSKELAKDEKRMTKSFSRPSQFLPAGPAHPYLQLQGVLGNRALGKFCSARNRTIQRKSNGSEDSPGTTSGVSKLIDSSCGTPLSQPTRSSMENLLQTDLSNVRIHTDTSSARAAHELKADAFTIGQDIYFGFGHYESHSFQGRELLTHELIHTIQQKNVSRISNKNDLFISEPSDQLEMEADRSAREILVDGGVGSVTASTSIQIQRKGPPSGTEEFQTGAEVASPSLLGRITEAGRVLVTGTRSVYERALAVGESSREQLRETTGEVMEAARGAVSWLSTTAGDAALQAANAIAGRWGGRIEIQDQCLLVTIPEILLLRPFQETIEDTGRFPVFLPMNMPTQLQLGRAEVALLYGLLMYVRASTEAALGPAVIRDIRVMICPFDGRYGGMANLYMAAAVGPRLTFFGGWAQIAAILIRRHSLEEFLEKIYGIDFPKFERPVYIPDLPIFVYMYGGLRGTGTGWFIGAVQDRVGIYYSERQLSFGVRRNLMGGVLFQGDAHVEVEAGLSESRNRDEILCRMVKEIGHWESGRAWQLTIPAYASITSNNAEGIMGPIEWGPMPIEDIVTAIRPIPEEWDCLGVDDILEIVKRVLCERGLLPPVLCGEQRKEEEREAEEPAAGIAWYPDPPPPTYVPTGLNSKDPIDMIWCKPRGEYRPITLADGTHTINDDPEENTYIVDNDEVSIGIDIEQELGADWPRQGVVFQKIPQSDGGERVKYRRVLGKLGFDWYGFQADHVYDLKFGGPDRSRNLWPIDEDVNFWAGQLHQKQRVWYRPNPGSAPTCQAISINDLNNRWFKIKIVRRVP